MDVPILADVVAVRSDSPPKNLLTCCRCGLNSIPCPANATRLTRFTCCAGCAEIKGTRNPETTAFVAQIGAEIDARVWRENFVGEAPGENSLRRMGA